MSTGPKPLYVIIHENVVRTRGALKEIQRIKDEEDFVEVTGPSYKVPSGLPLNRKILVCGGYLELCVCVQCEVLNELGYDASIYGKATVRLSTTSLPSFKPQNFV